MAIRLPLILIFVITVAIALQHRRSVRHESTLSFVAPPTADVPDTAAALRSLTATPSPDKLWLTDFAAFNTKTPGDWLIARCSGPFASQTEAEQSARSNAARSIYDLIVKRFGESSRSLASAAMQDIKAGQFQFDQLAEHFDRPYGTVWTDSILFDASAQNLDRLVEPHRRQLGAQQHLATLIQIAAFLLVATTWMVCLVVNWLTKGYFTLRLEVLAATITVLAVFLVLGGP